jgi:hypothetical protein
MLRRIGRSILTLALATTAGLFVTLGVAAPAHADGCYTWGRTLSQGMSGEDVRQLQIRVSGYPGYQSVLALDGDYGPQPPSSASSRPGVSPPTASRARRPSTRSTPCRTTTAPRSTSPTPS